VHFGITRHSGSSAPADALQLLWERLDGRRFDEVSFNRAGHAIDASIGREAPISMERDEREEVGRLAVLERLREICDDAPELRLEWFAIGLRP
jgi:hypothetical protein